MMDDVPARLILAYALIVLMILVAAGIAWWSIYYSDARIEKRKAARRRVARRPNDL